MKFTRIGNIWLVLTRFLTAKRAKLKLNSIWYRAKMLKRHPLVKVMMNLKLFPCQSTSLYLLKSLPPSKIGFSNLGFLLLQSTRQFIHGLLRSTQYHPLLDQVQIEVDSDQAPNCFPYYPDCLPVGLYLSRMDY